MQLPFDSTAFFNVFSTYNTAIWPLQIIVYLLAISLFLLWIKRTNYAQKASFYLLSILWLINGICYHLLYFSTINKAAFAFGVVFIAQALIFAFKAWKTPSVAFEISPSRWIASLALISYALFFYSAIGYFAGHQYPNAPIFGVAPCPTTVFTFGILLLMPGRVRWFQYLIPMLWAIIGTSAAFVLGVREDLGLLVAAIIFLGFQFQPRE